jgi:hypothetical protein
MRQNVIRFTTCPTIDECRTFAAANPKKKIAATAGNKSRAFFATGKLNADCAGRASRVKI